MKINAIKQSANDADEVGGLRISKHTGQRAREHAFRSLANPNPNRGAAIEVTPGERYLGSVEKISWLSALCFYIEVV
jgi:hypothetical protein